MILNTIFVPSFPHPLPLYFYNNISLGGWLSHPTASLITKKPLQPPLPSITQKTHPCIPLRFPISKSKHSVFRAPANTERYVRVYNNPVSVPRAAVPIFVFVHECYVGRLRLHRSSRGDETLREPAAAGTSRPSSALHRSPGVTLQHSLRVIKRTSSL